MKTYLECIPCFLNQSLKVMKHSGLDAELQKKILKDIMKMLSETELDKKPPEYARLVYDKISCISKIKDPYREIKKRDNMHAEKLAPSLKNMIDASRDPLLTAVKVSIAGNIMDFAANSDYDIKESIDRVLHEDFAINDYSKFKNDIINAKTIAYFADNCGEIIFDKLLIEKIKTLNSKCTIHLFVKAGPIINDATREDAESAGLGSLERVKVKTLEKDFLKTRKYKNPADYLKHIDISISKGQGNYERLSNINANIYFLLIAKCSVIARDLNTGTMKSILKCSKSTTLSGNRAGGG